MPSKRRKSSSMQPFMSAGLVRFYDVGEIEKIKLSPTAVIVIGIVVPIIVLLLRFLVP